MRRTAYRSAAQVLGIDVGTCDMNETLAHLELFFSDPFETSRRGYVCVAGVHGIMEAQRSPALAAVYANSEMTIPDGMPLVWVGRAQGHAAMERVTGPDLMFEMFRRPQFAHLTHFLYGGKEGVADELRDRLMQQFPQTRILGTYTPPYRDLTPAEDKTFTDEINELKPDILWISLSCPRQEIFMARHLPALETRLMFGVGAAFDYHTGRIRDSSEWVKRTGLQWVHRLIQDPRRLWWRYLRNNPAFLWRVGVQMLRGSMFSTCRPLAKPPKTDGISPHSERQSGDKGKTIA